MTGDRWQVTTSYDTGFLYFCRRYLDTGKLFKDQELMRTVALDVLREVWLLLLSYHYFYHYHWLSLLFIIIIGATVSCLECWELEGIAGNNEKRYSKYGSHANYTICVKGNICPQIGILCLQSGRLIIKMCDCSRYHGIAYDQHTHSVNGALTRGRSFHLPASSPGPSTIQCLFLIVV